MKRFDSFAVKFTNVNTAASPTLNVNSTGAKAMVKYGTTAVDANAWPAGAVVELIFDGASWVMLTETASRLSVPRSVRVNLASTSAASFDGSGNITPGVTGILGAANGGTGASSLAALATALAGQGIAKIATGSYVGTGTYGVDHPCSITFPFSPVLVQIVAHKSGSSYSVYPWGMTSTGSNGSKTLTFFPELTTEYAPSRGFGYDEYGKKSADGKTVYWYTASTGPARQLNDEGMLFLWIAIG